VWKLSDESLLAGLGSGDPDAAAEFLRRFQRRVFGLTFSILRDRAAVEEAAQDSFVRAWRYASAYDPRPGTVAAWCAVGHGEDADPLGHAEAPLASQPATRRS
jgi:DNA-directed RNA polymerase specialized sigma24 family protein